MNEKKGEVILIVDDDPYTLESISSLLNEHGYSVVACGNAADAMAKLQENRIDIILTDIRMPVVSGIELLEKIHSFNSEIPVILMTAYAELDIAIDAIRRGAFDFITKPYKHDYLIYIIEKAIKYRRLLNIEKDYKYTLEDTVRKRTQELTDALIIHKKAEEELKLRAQLLDAATDSIFVHDFEGNFIYVNEAAYKSRGYSKDELMGMNLYALDTLEYAKLTEQRIKKLPEKGATTFESAHLCKDRFMMSVEVHARIIKLGGRELVISVARDITERRQRERELGAIFDGIEDGILFIDKDCRILRVNRAILKMFDESDFSDLIGKKCFADFHKRDSMCENCPAEKALKDGNVHHAPRISNIIDKGRIVLAISAFPIKGEDGKVNNVIVHMKNITETVKLEDQILYQERLAGIGELAAGIAHEIRNPLGNIAASAQLCLSKYELPETARKHLKIILKNSENANKVVKSLLGFAKQREISFKTGDIGQVIKNACDFVKARCLKKRVILTKRWPRRFPQILLDEKAIEEAFLNFILNALDAMPNGGRLTIIAYPDFQNNEVVVIFSDTGEGISQEYLDKIFQPFFTTKKDGVGLGLCLAHQVINYHKGKLNIKSKVGQGTEIEVKLPISRE